MILKDEIGLKRTDVVHAIPALLHLIEMSPYYFSSYDHKLATVMADLGSPLGGFRHAEGFLPTYLHNLFRGAQAIGYAIAMGLLTRKFYKNNKSEIIRFEKVLKWIKSITIFQLCFGLSLLVLLGFSHLGTEAFRAFLLYILIALCCTFWGSYLILHPDILKAMPRLAPIPNFSPHSQGAFDENIETNEASSTHLPLLDCLNDAPTGLPEAVTSDNEGMTDAYLLHQQVLQQFMDRRKPFLEPRYSLSQMAIDIKIPKHHLTYLFNKGMNTSFTEYINQQRIEHIKLKTDLGALEKNTLEALALEAGFNSRITFIRAVQKPQEKILRPILKQRKL
jgi:AraC-like DNA-binding protein